MTQLRIATPAAPRRRPARDATVTGAQYAEQLYALRKVTSEQFAELVVLRRRIAEQDRQMDALRGALAAATGELRDRSPEPPQTG